VKGGGLFGKYGTISADTFKNTGYKSAKNALESYVWPASFKNASNMNKLSSLKIAYAYERLPSGAKVPKYILQNGSYVKDGDNKIDRLEPNDFKDILEYIIENKIEDKNNYLPVQVVRNDRYGNFQASLDYLIESAKTKGKIRVNESDRIINENDVNALATMPKIPPTHSEILTNAVNSALSSPQAQELANKVSSVTNSKEFKQATNGAVGTTANLIAKNVPGGAFAGMAFKLGVRAAPTVLNVAAKKFSEDPQGALKTVSSLANSVKKSGNFGF
jgi:hypothetical protein